MRIKPAAMQKSPLRKQTSSPKASSPVDHPYRNVEFPGGPTKERLPTIVSKSVSPDASDSDPDENYLNLPFHNKQRSASQGNVSFRSSEGGKSKRPVAVPRKKLSSASFSVSKSQPQNEENFRPPLPPKPPSEAPAIPRREKISLKKLYSLDSALDPQRPVQRPRNSEIRRAKDRARTDRPRAKGTPELCIVDEDGLETASTYSGKSVASNISSKSAPSGSGQRGGEKMKKKRSQSTQEDGTGTRKTKSTQLQVPERPPRPRHKSEGESDSDPPPLKPVKHSASVPNEKESLNADVANTLLRFIITSEDQSLKNALRDLINQDSKVVTSLSDQ